MSIGTDGSSQETITVGELRIRYLVDGSATGGMGVFELSVPPGSRVPPPHSHPQSHECAGIRGQRQ